MRIFITTLFLLLTVPLLSQEKEFVMVTKTIKLMNDNFEITVVDLNKELGYIHIDQAIAEIRRIEKMLSDSEDGSETSKINAHAGIKPVKVSHELYRLIERSKQISEITDGAFDISYASMNKIWKFDGSMKEMPSKEAIKKSVELVDYRKIVLNAKNGTVFLKRKGMKISFNAIAMGYAADKAKQLLVSKRVRGGTINAAGDLTTWGTKANGEKWSVGIADPLNGNTVLSEHPVIESSVATADGIDDYVVFDRIKYPHIIDPRTGYPAQGVKKVYVFAKNAELCDALATAIFVMGKDDGMLLVEQLGGTEAVLIDEGNRVHKSGGILVNPQK